MYWKIDFWKFNINKIEILEEPLKVIKKLQDQNGLENSQVVFECELNKSNLPVEWLFNDTPISECFEPGSYIISQVDNKYTLTVPKCKLKDQGMFCLSIPKYQMKTKALLTVDGKWYVLTYLIRLIS